MVASGVINLKCHQERLSPETKKVLHYSKLRNSSEQNLWESNLMACFGMFLSADVIEFGHVSVYMVTQC